MNQVFSFPAWLLTIVIVIGLSIGILTHKTIRSQPTIIEFKINDTVYIPSIMLTGVVNNINGDGKTAYIITDRGTKLDYINTAILRKVPTLEKPLK